MKLLRLRVDGFGSLRGEFALDPERVAVIVDQNETGKSTLLAAVSAALYGLDGDKRRTPALTPLDRWRPWDGGSYGLQLDLESRGETYTIRRDFARETVEVWNGRGQEVTAEFREGKDDFPVGKKLLGLDLKEFEKCAFVRQSDLDHVVPAEEKTRRAGTLQARLENAADTRGGDTNATEALQLLEAAVKKYTCPEVEFTGLVENAIQRIETKRRQLEDQVKGLERELAEVAGPLAELSKLGEEEAVARGTLARIDEERKGTLATEIRARLREDDERRAEVAKVEAEVRTFAACAHVPDNAEAELSQTIGQLDQAQRNLDSFENRHRDETARERSGVEAELARFQNVADSTAADADRLVSLASEIRRLADEDGRRRAELSVLRGQLAGKGIEQDRVRALAKRLEGLDEDQSKLLRGQSEIGLVFQSDLQTLETLRNESTESLRSIDAQRGGLRIPGWLLVALGFGGGIAGGALVALAAPQRLWVALLSGGAILVAIGGALLFLSASMRKGQRTETLRKLTEAQRKINQLRGRRVESEQALLELSRSLGYPNPIELMRDWNEHARINDVSAPMRRAQEQLVALETARRAVFEETRKLLERFGGGPVDLGHVERVANDIRGYARLRERLEGLDAPWGWIADEKRAAAAEVAGHQERALRILQSAGLVYDPHKPWADHQSELAERVRGRSRLKLLRDELLPQAQRRAMPGPQRSELEAQLAAIEAEGPRPRSEAPKRSPLELEKESRQLRDRVDEMQKRRTDLRLRVDEVCRRYEAEHPEKLQQIDRLDRALKRARRFQRAIELAGETIKAVALDTHRRWAEFLNQRVGELLGAIGGRVDEIKFGDDLDFSIRLWNGQHIGRGKGVSQLSAGMRDQLYLAIRLAISEFLSPPDNPIPLLIDDVYATSDDDRARAGMRLLIEHFAKHHQIIVVSCHRHRLETLAKLDPELYQSRVQWLDARTSSVTF